MPIPEALLAYAAYRLMKETVGTPSDWIANAKKNKQLRETSTAEQADSAKKAAAIAELSTVLQKDIDKKNAQESTESNLKNDDFGIAGMIK